MCKLLLDRGAVIDTQALSSPWVAAVSGTVDNTNKTKREQVINTLAEHFGTCMNAQELSRALLIVTGPYSECRKLEFGDDNDNDNDVNSSMRCELHGLLPPVCAEKTFPNGNTPAAMRMLLQLGADPNAIGGYFETPLIAAAVMGKELYVKILLDFGADIYYRSEIYGTAAEAALERGLEDIVTLLLEAEEGEEGEADDSANARGSARESSGQSQNDLLDSEEIKRWRDTKFKSAHVHNPSAWSSEEIGRWRDMKFQGSYVFDASIWT